MPRRKRGEKKIRVTLDLTPQFYQRFEQLEELVDAESKASLLRNALQLYEFVAKRTLDGWTFQVLPPSGEAQPIMIKELSIPEVQ